LEIRFFLEGAVAGANSICAHIEPKEVALTILHDNTHLNEEIKKIG